MHHGRIKCNLIYFFTTKRESLNLSVRELGKKADVSYTVIYDFEKRGVLPKIGTLLKIAESLGLSTEVDFNSSQLCLKFEDKVDNSIEEFKVTPEQELYQILRVLGIENSQDIKEIINFIKFKLSGKEHSWKENH